MVPGEAVRAHILGDASRRTATRSYRETDDRAGVGRLGNRRHHRSSTAKTRGRTSAH
jgi:hypothetical protein